MMHHSKKLLSHGDAQYFNEKRPVNLQVKDTVGLGIRFRVPRTGMPGITLPLRQLRFRLRLGFGSTPAARGGAAVNIPGYRKKSRIFPGHLARSEFSEGGRWLCWERPA